MSETWSEVASAFPVIDWVMRAEGADALLLTQRAQPP